MKKDYVVQGRGYMRRKRGERGGDVLCDGRKNYKTNDIAKSHV